MKLFTGLNHRIHVLYFDTKRNYRENVLNNRFHWGGLSVEDLHTAKFLLWYACKVDDVKLANAFMVEVICGLDVEEGFSIWDWEIQEWLVRKMETAR